MREVQVVESSGETDRLGEKVAKGAGRIRREAAIVLAQRHARLRTKQRPTSWQEEEEGEQPQTFALSSLSLRIPHLNPAPSTPSNTLGTAQERPP